MKKYGKIFIRDIGIYDVNDNLLAVIRSAQSYRAAIAQYRKVNLWPSEISARNYNEQTR